MKTLIFQTINTGFFPRYYKALKQALENNGDECLLVVPNSGRNKRNELPCQKTYGTRLNWFIHSRLYKLTGIQDVFSIFDTYCMVRILKKYRPDVIHLNLINDKCLNIPMFVSYVNKYHIPVIWTMHDCRAFTGQCPYFDEVHCNRWKTGCGRCPQCETKIDNTHCEWLIRKRWHTAIENLTIVTPSEWLASFVRQSFFKDKTVRVIYNGVDLSGFSKTVKCDLRQKYNISTEKKIILGCAINWEQRKGLTFFEVMVGKLPSNYQIVLVGGIDEEKRKALSKKNIICTGCTSTFDEMVALYQSAAVFCNPTLADNFPTTNIEALAAGTPVVTFKTGGSPEAIDSNTGIVVEQGDINGLCKAVVYVAEHRDLFTTEKCKQRSLFFSNDQYNEYVKLYHSMVK